MSVKLNVVANYIGQAYQTFLGIVVTPLYLGYLGVEAYGLVGIFALMQAWMSLLDLGLSPTLGRQAAYARGIDGGFKNFKLLLKSFEVIFFVLALFIALIVYFLSDWLSQNWIKAVALDVQLISYCIVLMGFMVGLRWISSLYRSGINGLEDQIWLNLANILMASLRFIGALVLLVFFTKDVRHFFEYQLVVSVIELFIFSTRLYYKIPVEGGCTPVIAFNWPVVRSISPFALGIAYTTGVWILITQSDKLILSGILTLSEFGYFSMVALISGGVTILSAPISQAIMPRLTVYFSQNKKNELLKLYSKSSQFVTVISLSTSLMIGIYAEPLIYAWSGSLDGAAWGGEILLWFALGNGVLSVSAFQYYLQNAFGDLRLHIVGSTLSALIQVPLIFYAATYFGAKGAAIAWFSFRLIWFLFWFPIVHAKFIPGFHMNWLLKDIMPIVLCTTFFALIFGNFIVLDLGENRFILLIKMICIGMVIFMLSAMSSKEIRCEIATRLKAIK